MTKKVEIGTNSKVNIKWKVNAIDYSHDKSNELIAKFAKKYKISKYNISLEPVFIKKDENGEVTEYTNEITQNIQYPEFQHKLFKQLIDEREIKDCNFDEIIKIDDLINNGINYEDYENSKTYSIKWIKWSNFMSYGPDNFFDFTKLKGLVQLTSDPSNQGGKTTFSIDLLRFLLFGKVTSREDDWTLSRVFNRHIPEATEVTVEGCVCIDGIDYIIKRVLTRPQLSKRTDKSKVSQKVYYYKLVNDEYIDLEDEDNEAGSSTKETNKIIKDSIGNERDFDLMICVDSDNLKGLISLKDTERGRLISRWIGLLPLEEKDKIARETFNKIIVPKLMLNKYDKNNLQEVIDEKVEENDNLTKEVIKLNKSVKEFEKKVDDYKKMRDGFLSSKQSIDESLTNVDIVTLEKKIYDIKEDGRKKREEKNNNEETLKELKDVFFDKQKYLDNISLKEKLSNQLTECRGNYKRVKSEIESLKNGEYCPTCGAKLKNIDNSNSIKEKEAELNKYTENGNNISNEYNKISDEINKLSEIQEKYNKKTKLEIIIEKNQSDIDNYLLQYKEFTRTLNDIEKNKAAIEQNNNINNSLNVVNANIKQEEINIQNFNSKIVEYNLTIENNKKVIKTNSDVIKVIETEEKTVRNWKIYLELIGKNGISKLVLRNVLPLINGHLKHLLSPDICDFTVEVDIDDRNDVRFNMIHDNVKSSLGGGSGFEKTAASLALRSVLSKISSFSRPSFVVFDEVLGGVSAENYDNMKKLYDKMIVDYGLCFQISHLKSIMDWHDGGIITISKENNISKISNN